MFTTTLNSDREIHPNVMDLQSMTRQLLLSLRRCKSVTRGWISLSLYKVVVDYFSPSALNPYYNKIISEEGQGKKLDF